MWDDEAMRTLEVPLANPIGSPKHVPADYYYRIPVRSIYKQYPVYAPGREPAGYMEWLKKQEPVIVWDDASHKPKLQTDADWIKAGEIAFDAPSFDPTDPGGFRMEDVTSNACIKRAVCRSLPTEFFRSCTMSSGRREKLKLVPFPAACVIHV